MTTRRKSETDSYETLTGKIHKEGSESAFL